MLLAMESEYIPDLKSGFGEWNKSNLLWSTLRYLLIETNFEVYANNLMIDKT